MMAEHLGEIVYFGAGSGRIGGAAGGRIDEQRQQWNVRLLVLKIRALS
jgi:hypothetical protein